MSVYDTNTDKPIGRDKMSWLTGLSTGVGFAGDIFGGNENNPSGAPLPPNQTRNDSTSLNTGDVNVTGAMTSGDGFDFSDPKQLIVAAGLGFLAIIMLPKILK